MTKETIKNEITKTFEVEMNVSDFDTETLIKELANREVLKTTIDGWYEFNLDALTAGMDRAFEARNQGKFDSLLRSFKENVRLWTW